MPRWNWPLSAAMALALGCADPITAPVDGTPLPVQSTRLALRNSQACVLEPDGGVVCWGTGGPQRITPADGSLRFASIHGGIQHMCGISTDSTAYCWGRNNLAQLGDGTRSDRAIPTRVATSKKFIVIASMAAATCAIDPLGYLYCWGNNAFGELANSSWGANETAMTPVRAHSRQRFRDLSWTSALSVGRRVYGWGTSGDAGYIYAEHVEPGNCSSYFWSPFAGRDCLVPTPIKSQDRFAKIGGCLLSETGVLSCLGGGRFGELGDGRYGDNVYSVSPVPVNGDVRYLATSGRCALDLVGAAYCWGNNAFGQLGIGVTGGFRATPTPVATSARFVEIMSNGNTCALSADGGVWCWGDNGSGELGPTFLGARSNIPVLVELPPL